MTTARAESLVAFLMAEHGRLFAQPRKDSGCSSATVPVSLYPVQPGAPLPIDHISKAVVLRRVVAAPPCLLHDRTFLRCQQIHARFRETVYEIARGPDGKTAGRGL
jgi:hypothetical protein